MNSFKNILIIILCTGLATSCTKPNVLTDMSQKNSDDALFIEAQKQIDNSQWDAGISIIENQISAGYRAQRNVVNTLAGAYAGKCGINFVNMVNGLKGASGAASQIFPYLMSVFSGVTPDPVACETAVTLMESIGDVNARTSDENLFLSILGIARIATNLAAELDSVDHNGVLDSPLGALATSSNICHEWSAGSPLHPWLAGDPAFAFYPPPGVQAAHFLKDLEVQRIAAGVGLLVENLTALGTIIGPSNSVVTAVNSVKASCTSLSIVCDVTDSTAISNKMIYAFRALLDSSSMGFGTCTPGSVVMGQICCPTLKPPPAPAGPPPANQNPAWP